MEYVWVTGTCGTEQKESPAIFPEPTGGQTAPASFTHVVPGAQLATESTAESGFDVASRHEGVLPGRGFRRGFSDASRSLPPWPGAVHAPRRSLRGPGEPGAGQHQALGAANGGARTRFIIHRNMGPLARSTNVRRKGLVQVQITGKRIDGGNQDRIQLVSQAA